MLDSFLLGQPVESLKGTELVCYSLCRDMPPHFVQALRGKGVLRTGPGFRSWGYENICFVL